MKKWIFAALLGAGLTLAHAEAPAVRFVGNLGIAFGGDILASGVYTSGETYEIRAGKGVTLALGADFRVAEHVRIQATIGTQVDKTNAANGEIAFKRSPFEILAFYDLNPNMRLGGGLRSARNAELTATGAAAGLPAAGPYDNTLGTVVEWQYLFNPAPAGEAERKVLWAFTVRLVGERFRQANASSGYKDGGHLGLGFNLYY